MAFNMRVQLPNFLGGVTMRLGDTSEAVKVASQYQRLLEELETALKTMRSQSAQNALRGRSMRDKLMPAVARRSEFILNVWNKYPNKEEITDELEKTHWGRERRMMLVTNLFQTFLPEMEAVGNPIIEAVRLPVAITPPSLARAEKWNMLEKLVAEWDDLGAGCFAGRDHWDFIRKQPKVFSTHDDPEFNVVFDVQKNPRSGTQVTGQKQIHHLIEDVERRRTAWMKEWSEVSAGFLLEDENFRSPHAVSTIDSSKDRAFQRRASDFSQVRMSVEDQKRLVWDYNHILDQLQMAVGTQLELQGRHVKANEVHNAEQLRSAGSHQLDMVRCEIEARHHDLARFVNKPEEQRRVLQFQENVGSDVGVWSMRRRRKLRDEMFRVQNLCGEAMMDSPGLAHVQRTIQLVTNLCCMDHCPSVARGVQKVPTIVCLVVLVIALVLLIIYVVRHGFNIVVHILLGLICLALLALGALLALRTFSPEVNQVCQDMGHDGFMNATFERSGPSYDQGRGLYAQGHGPTQNHGLMDAMFGGGAEEHRQDPYAGDRFQHDGYGQRGRPQDQPAARGLMDEISAWGGFGQQGAPSQQDGGYGPPGGRYPPTGAFDAQGREMHPGMHGAQPRDGYGSQEQLLPRDGYGGSQDRHPYDAQQTRDVQPPDYRGYGGPPHGDPGGYGGSERSGGFGGSHRSGGDGYGPQQGGGYGGPPQGGFGGPQQGGGSERGGYGGPQQGGFGGGSQRGGGDPGGYY